MALYSKLETQSDLVKWEMFVSKNANFTDSLNSTYKPKS